MHGTTIKTKPLLKNRKFRLHFWSQYWAGFEPQTQSPDRQLAVIASCPSTWWYTGWTFSKAISNICIL